MASDFSVFDFRAHPVRVVMQEGAPWFVAVDVCRILDLSNSRKAVAGLDEDEVGVTNSYTPPSSLYTLNTPTEKKGVANSYSSPLNIISESGLYALIFRSRKETAKTFRKWVTSEVLPSLRQHGRYEVKPAPLTLAGGMTTLPAYFDAAPAAGALAIKDRVRLGSLCKRYAAALGLKPLTSEDEAYGVLRCYPMRLCEQVLAEILKTKVPAHREELEALICQIAEDCESDTHITIADILKAAKSSGIKLDEGTGDESKRIGRRLQYLSEKILSTASGRPFQIHRHRTNRGVRYTLNFTTKQLL